MAQDQVAVRFKDVSFRHAKGKEILDEASFALRPGSKFTIMGQNGAGKTTLLNLITGKLKPDSGKVFVDPSMTVAHAEQVIAREQLTLTLREFFEIRFTEKIYNIDKKIKDILEVVNLHVDFDKKMSQFSGGQQARLLLASALIQEPDLLILDEPTNNLDSEGVAHLLQFLMMYDKTCIVISHDADFLNMFTDGVLYLDIFTKKIEQYVGDYYVVVSEIAARIEKENRKNAQFQKKIKENKEKINYFANKGGKMRAVAKRMREEVARMESEKVTVRQEDKAIHDFVIPEQKEVGGEIVKISSVSLMQNHEIVQKTVNISLRKNEHLLLAGPNGIGKSTFLELLASNTAPGVKIADGVKIGYYRQDFSTLDFNMTVIDSLKKSLGGEDEDLIRKTAASFLLSGDIVYSQIGSLSEGQKGLVAFAGLVLETPGILILDEPTNHINFRHLPAIARALDSYKGTMILVSHVPEFVSQIRIDYDLDLGK